MLTSEFNTLKSMAEYIQKTSMSGFVEECQTCYIGKERAKKLAKAFKWATEKFGAFEINGETLAKVRMSTYSGSEFKAARLLSLGLLKERANNE